MSYLVPQMPQNKRYRHPDAYANKVNATGSIEAS